ncbi:MAG: aminotransferase class I/II-fold pyridoxal phosphate-dependent enzyme, partial [Verrucomicrobiaceae bacterium]
GAFYVFPDVSSTGLSGRDFAFKLLEEQSIAVVPGSAFGPSGENCVRCCYATAPDLLVKAMDGMETFVRKYKK